MLKDNSLKIDCFGYGDFNEFNSIKIKIKLIIFRLINLTKIKKQNKQI